MSKILFILRCYSGFEQSLINKKWEPSGAPTIAKILEIFQNENDNNVLFLSRSNNKKINSIKGKKLKIKNLNIPIYLLKTNFTLFGFSKFSKLYNELYNFIFIIFYLIKLKPNIIYSDHSNIHFLSLIARYLNITTVLRIMGIKNDMRDCITNNSIYSKILKWSYRAPFSVVIATQDGAGAEIWMKKALSKNVPRKTLLNGVDLSINPKSVQINKNTSKNKFIITFIGRLEVDKAPDRFVEAFLKVRNKIPNKFHCFIIGSGSMKQKLINMINRENAMNDVTFFSDMNHSSIYYLLDKTDIYVSLNRMGNLSNTNIEAMIMGKTIIMPKSQVKKGIDIYTDKIIKDNAVYRVSSSDSIDEIYSAIIKLAENKNLRNSLESEIKNIAIKVTYSWQKRIAWEYKLLSSIKSYDKDKIIKYLESI